MKRIVFVLAIALTTLAACKNGKTETTEPTVETTTETKETPVEAKELDNIETFIIADHREDCTGVAKMKCMLVKRADADEWTYMYDSIEGFTYEEGYEYKLEVKSEEVPNPPADGSSIRYILVKQISKVKK